MGGGRSPFDVPGADEVLSRLRITFDVDTRDLQQGLAQAKGIIDQFAGGRTAQASAGLIALKTLVNDTTTMMSMLGIPVSVTAAFGEFLKQQQSFLDLQRAMYDVAREATRGGIAIEWSQGQGEAIRGVLTQTATWARDELRRTDQEIAQTFQAIAKAGMFTVQEQGRSALASLEEVRRAATTAFTMEGVLGFSPQQVQTVLQAMHVNLRQSVDEIYEAIARYGQRARQISTEVNLPLQEQAIIVSNIMQQYSKFGVTLDEVSETMRSLTADTKEQAGALQNLGLTYDIMQTRMRARVETTPEQVVAMMHQLSSEEIRRVFTSGLQAQEITNRQKEISRRLQETGVGRILGFTEEEMGSGRAGALLMEGRRGTGERIRDIEWPMLQRTFSDLMNLGVAVSLAMQKLVGTGGMPEEVMAPWLIPIARNVFGPAAAEAYSHLLDVASRDVARPITATLESTSAERRGDAAKQLTALEEGSRVQKDHFVSTQEYYRNSLEYLKQIVENTMGWQQRIGWGIRTAYREFASEDVRAAAAQRQAEAVGQEIASAAAKIPEGQERAGLWERAADLLGRVFRMQVLGRTATGVPTPDSERLWNEALAEDVLSTLGYYTESRTEVAKRLREAYRALQNQIGDIDKGDIDILRGRIMYRNEPIPVPALLGLVQQFSKLQGYSGQFPNLEQLLQFAQQQGITIPEVKPPPSPTISPPAGAPPQTTPSPPTPTTGPSREGQPTSMLPKELNLKIDHLTIRTNDSISTVRADDVEDVMGVWFFENSQYKSYD